MNDHVKSGVPPSIVELPADLIANVRAGCGARGNEWLATLPKLIRILESRWSIRIESPFPAGEYNFVAPALTDAGAEVVIKVAPPWDPPEIGCEAEYLKHRSGDGCVRIIDESVEHRAILIERIKPGENLVEYFSGDPESMLSPAIDTLKRITRPLPDRLDRIHSLRVWFEGLQRSEGTAFPSGYARRALEYYERLAADAADVYLHGDFHPGNLVRGQGDDFVVIDPKGVAGPIGYDIAVFLLNYLRVVLTLPGDRKTRLDWAVDAFAEAFEMPHSDVREWAFAQTVLSAWWSFSDTPELYDGSVVIADHWGV